MMYGFSRTGGLGDPPIPYIKLGKGIINVSLLKSSKEIYSKINELSLNTSGSISTS